MSFFILTFLKASPNLGVAPACNESINVSLSINCQAVIIPDNLLEGLDDTMEYKIFITSPIDSTGNFSNNGTDKVSLLKTGIYQYSVVDENGHTCWGIIQAEDKFAPIFINLPRDTFVRCHIELTEDGLGATPPTIQDNCDSLTPIFESASVPLANTCDSLVTVAINWKAVDNSGNETNAIQEIVFIRPKETQFLFPEDVILSCGEDSLEDLDNTSKTGTIKVQTGRILNGIFQPTDTTTLEENSNFCNLGLSKRDTRKTSNCDVKLTRIWEILDWCSPAQRPIIVDTQFITYADTLAPIFLPAQNGNIQNAQIVEFGLDCRFTVALNTPIATDNCDTMPTVEMYEVAQLNNGIWTPIGSNTSTIVIPADTLRLGYRAFDECYTQNKEDTTFTYLITRDLTAPAAICASDLVISVANDFDAILEAEVVDHGSEDTCGEIIKEIRRKGTTDPWSSFISLPCELIDSQLRVELRVSDLSGNSTVCWTTVRLEDKLPPLCHDLANDTTTCIIRNRTDFGNATDSNNNRMFDDTEWVNMTPLQIENYDSIFGNPACKENISCQTYNVEQQYQLLEKGCGAAEIKRRYRAIDTQNNVSEWSEQLITIVYEADWIVVFPPDWEGTCVDRFPAPFIEIQNGSCDKLEVKVSEKIFNTDEESCLKIERTFSVINLCTFQQGIVPLTIKRQADTLGVVNDTLKISSDSLANIGHFNYKQILKIISSEKPTLVINEDIETCLSGIYSDTLVNTGKDTLYCAELRTFSASAIDCIGNSIEQYNWNLFENEVVTKSGTGSSFTQPVLPNVKYTVQFLATDACNNISVDQKNFTFEDCARPTLFIRRGITLELKERTIKIKATDFDIGTSDNCTEKETLLNNFRIWHEILGAAPTTIAKIKELPTEITFGCAQLATQEVYIYAFDEEDNYDRVSTFIIIQDNQESCIAALLDGMVAGQIIDEKGAKVEGVSVTVEGGKNANYTTQTDGNFEFELPQGKEYAITPLKTSEPLNGVTTFDLILISKHILGISPFKSPYQYIAADVNKSGTITAYDIVQLRQVILKIIPEFPNNQSWRFIDNSYQFTTNNPLEEPFPESVLIEELPEEQMGINFIGVKIGDINGNALVNRLEPSTGRTIKDILEFQVEDRLVVVDEIITIPFLINDLKTIEGLQFSLDFKSLTLLNLEEGLVEERHMNQADIEKGHLVISWNKERAGLPTSNLFTLTFKANRRELLSNLLTIDHQEILAEAYTTTEESLGIQLNFSKVINTPTFELFQNKPNPFESQTTVGFYIPEGENVQLRVMDIQGRILLDIQKEYKAGFHEINLDKQTIGGVGILYYQMTAGENIATKKMIVLE